MRKSTIIANILGFFLVSAIVIFAFFVENKKEKREETKVTKKERVKLLPVVISKDKPKLAIVIDDVGSQEELDALIATGVKLTPAFFPPTEDFPDTPLLARSVEEYIVHLPLQAKKHNRPQEMTLMIDDSYFKIQREILKIKKDFKDLKLLNNHTGSAFTEHSGAMKRLFRVLQENNIDFLDSRTTKDTVGVAVGREYGMRVVERNVFIDNELDVAYILDNIQLAVKKAKQEGIAVAIGHPKPETIEALGKAKDLLKDVELIYVRSLYQ